MGKRNKNKGNSDSKARKNKFSNNLKNILKKNVTIQSKQINLKSIGGKNGKIQNNQTNVKAVKSKNGRFNTNLSLRERMQEKLRASRFRYINEQMYTSKGKDSKELFKKDPASYDAYHQGYRLQVERWPLNPLDVIIESISKFKNLRNLVIADFGCGDARLAKTLKSKVQAVHSFDLVASSADVVECDMAKCPLPIASVDVAVYCLSLMGTNLQEYLVEANRILRFGGILKIAEVESRFQNVDHFIEQLRNFGFTLTWKDFSCNMFHFLDFKKDRSIRNKQTLPNVTLEPCLYKKR